MLLALKIALLQHGMSQRKLAQLSDIPEARVSTLIHGWRAPSANERRRLAAALEKPEAELFDVNATIESRSIAR